MIIERNSFLFYRGESKLNTQQSGCLFLVNVGQLGRIRVDSGVGKHAGTVWLVEGSNCWSDYWGRDKGGSVRGDVGRRVRSYDWSGKVLGGGHRENGSENGEHLWTEEHKND